jgi:hypothetical protein
MKMREVGDKKTEPVYDKIQHLDTLNRKSPWYNMSHSVEQRIADGTDPRNHPTRRPPSYQTRSANPDAVSAVDDIPIDPNQRQLEHGGFLGGGREQSEPTPQPSKEQLIQSLLHSHNFLAQAVNSHFNASTLPAQLTPAMGPPLVQSQPPPQPTYADQKDVKFGTEVKQDQLVPQSNFPPIGPSQFTNPTPEPGKAGLLPTPALDDAATLAADSKGKTDTTTGANGKPIAPPPAASGAAATSKPPKEGEKTGEGEGEEKKEGEERDKYEMSETDLARLMMSFKSKGFAGVVASDEIDKVIPYLKARKPKLGFIMNTDPRDKPGRHWVAVEIDWQRRPSVHYYDPYGDPPQKATVDGLKRIVAARAEQEATEPLKLKVNRVPNQREDTSTCGLHSARFLMDMFNGRTFAAATHFNTTEGEAKARGLVGGAMPKFEYLM